MSVLKITRTISHGHHEHPKPQVFLALSGKPFNHEIFNISPDHTQITLFPDHCFKNDLFLWLVVDSTRVIGACPDEKITYNIKEISLMHCREDEGDSNDNYYNYEFSEAKTADIIKYLLSSNGSLFVDFVRSW